MARGRPPKPTEAKRRTGNPGKRKLPEPVSVVPAPAGMPKPPGDLREPGRALWRAVWADGSPWLAPTDAAMVRLLCQTVDEREEVLEIVRKEGRTFRTGKGYIGQHPAVSEARALDAQMIQLLSLLGFSPADRSRLGLTEVRRMSRLADLAAKHRGER